MFKYLLLFVFAIYFQEAFAFHKNKRSSCPSGYTKSGDTCFKVVTQEPQAYCPYGDLVNGQCVKEYKAKARCPVGYIKNEDGYRTRCVSLQKIKPEFACAEGVYDGSVCKREVRMDKICPNGSSFSGNMCTIFTAAEPGCPRGYEYSDSKLGHKKFSENKLGHKFAMKKKSFKKPLGTCINTKKVPMVSICENGFKMENNKCLRTRTEEPHCPYSNLVNGQCMTEKPVEFRCPNGARESKSKCVREKMVNAEIYCESDWELVNGRCEKMVEVPLQCPKNSTYDSFGNCVETGEPKVACPSGYHLDLSVLSKNKSCTKQSTTPLIPYCHKGFVVKGDSCVSVKEHKSSCPLGSKETRDGCVVMHEATLLCPDEKKTSVHFFRENKNKTCTRNVVVSPERKCTKGYEFSEKNGACIKTVVVPAQMICKYGKLEKNTCVQYFPHKPEVFCPEDYEMVNDRCQKVEVSDCKKVEYEMRCNNMVCEGKNCPEYFDEGFGLIKSEIYPSGIIHPKVKCVRVPVTKVGDCSRVVYAEPLERCSFGELSDGMCIEVQPVEASYSCARGVLSGNSCKYVAEKEASYSCPDNAELIHDTDETKPFCSYTETVKPEYRCSIGTLVEGNRCAEYVPKKNKAFQKKMPLQYGCKDGYKRHLHFFGDSFVCVKELFADPAESCESPFEMKDGYCERIFKPDCPFGDGKTCKSLKHKEAEWRCREGAISRIGSKVPLCKVTEYSEKMSICTDYGANLVDGRCVKYFEPPRKNIVEESVPKKMCPAGYSPEKSKSLFKHHQRESDMCVASSVETSKLTCKRGEFVESEQMCREYVSKVCPAGAHESYDSCYSYTKYEPKYKCAVGTLYDGYCAVENNGVVDYQCNKGEEVSASGMCLTKFQTDVRCPDGMNFTNGVCEMKVYQEPEKKFKLFHK